MTLLIKNNLTTIYTVDVKGSGGSGLIEFVKVAKKSENINSEWYLKENYNLDSGHVRDKMVEFIYGNNHSHSNKTSHDQVVLFSIYSDDLIEFGDNVDPVSMKEEFSNLDISEYKH
jgi:hypothetical protein